MITASLCVFHMHVCSHAHATDEACVVFLNENACRLYVATPLCPNGFVQLHDTHTRTHMHSHTAHHVTTEIACDRTPAYSER